MRVRFFKCLSLLLVLICCQDLEAARPALLIKPQPLGRWVRSGVVVGGEAGRAFSLLSLKRQTLRDGSEQWTFVFGNELGRPLEGLPGFFHLQIHPQAGKLILDLAQVQKTTIDRMDIQKIASASPWLQLQDVTMDPQDLSTNVTFQFKKPVRAKAEVASAALKITIQPDRGGE